LLFKIYLDTRSDIVNVWADMFWNMVSIGELAGIGDEKMGSILVTSNSHIGTMAVLVLIVLSQEKVLCLFDSGIKCEPAFVV
jgi:hypothetical protein